MHHKPVTLCPGAIAWSTMVFRFNFQTYAFRVCTSQASQPARPASCSPHSSHERVASVTERPKNPHRSRLHRIFFWIAISVGILIVATLIAGDIVLHRIGPTLKAKVIATLSSHFDSRVQLDRFQVSVLKGFEVSGTGLKLYPNHLSMKEPLIQADRFSFHVLGWRQMLQTPDFIARVTVKGLVIHLPPKSERHQLHSLTSGSSSGAGPADMITVGQIDVDNARLIFDNDQPGKVPLTFVIHKLVLHSVGAGQAMQFHAILVNPKPLGNIDSTGHFGPFDVQSPGDTPVDGSYSFTHADLSTIHGIGGMLSSKGSYKGQLNQITVDGTTDTPDFQLSEAGHPMPLRTTFHAIVDGTNGDTQLQPVDAWLAKTHIVAKGQVVRAPDGHGRDIQLDFTVDSGRIEDLLQLAAKSQPLMNGDVQIHGKMDLPPGKESVIDKLQLQGDFSLDNLHFTSPKVQTRVDELSLRGQGHADQAKKETDALKAGKLQPADTADVPSQMKGQFTFGNGAITLPALDYHVPGANVELSGNYSLKTQALNFTGTARLQAHVSQMVTGWKSWLLKPVDPFFAKNGAGTQVPISITGTRSHPNIGLAFH